MYGAPGLMSRGFVSGPGDRGSIPDQVIPKTQKMVLDAALLNTQNYKVRIKGKVEQSREWSSVLPYRTLYSYNLIWAVCHLFPQQKWQTHTYSVSGNHWPGEPRDLRKTMSAHKFRPAFGATSKTYIFYKYVVFKHSSSFLHKFFAADTHSLFSVTFFLFLNRSEKQKKWISLADIHFFNIL